MKQYFIIFSFAVLIIFSVLLFMENRKNLEKYSEERRSMKFIIERLEKTSDSTWMNAVDLTRLTDNNGNMPLSIDTVQNCVLIVISLSSSEGCETCIQLELAEWQSFYEENRTHSKFCIFIVASNASNKVVFLNQLKSMHINMPVLFDNSGFFMKRMDIEWTPYICFLYHGRILASYIGDMNNREITKTMMDKFKFFITHDLH